MSTAREEPCGTERPYDVVARFTLAEILAIIHGKKPSCVWRISPARAKVTYTGRFLVDAKSRFSSASATLKRKDFPTPRLPLRMTGARLLRLSTIARSLAVST